MTLLSICQQAARAVPLAAPSIIVGNTNETASLLLACAQDEGNALSRRYNWLSLVKEHTFSTVASTEDYSLPSDFSRLENQTLWDRNNYESIRGPLSSQQWQEYKSSVLATTNTVWKRFRIRDVSGTVKFSIHPTPDAAETMVFEYVSDNWCETSGGSGQSAWAADTDVGVLDEYLLGLGIKWRLLNRLGMIFDEEREEYEREVIKAIARDGGAPILNLTGRARYHLIGPENVQDTGFG